MLDSIKEFYYPKSACINYKSNAGDTQYCYTGEDSLERATPHLEGIKRNTDSNAFVDTSRPLSITRVGVTVGVVGLLSFGIYKLVT